MNELTTRHKNIEGILDFLNCLEREQLFLGTKYPKFVGNWLCASFHSVNVWLNYTQSSQQVTKNLNTRPKQTISSSIFQFNTVQLLSHVRWCPSPTLSLLKLMSIESVMPSNHLILCHPLLPPSIFPSIRVFSKRVTSLHHMAKVLEFQLQHQSFQWIFRTDFL